MAQRSCNEANYDESHGTTRGCIRPMLEPTTVEKLQGLPWSIASNAANSLFSQFTFFGSVFILFLNALGMSKSEIGFLLSLLPFSGLLSLVFASFAARFGYKRTYTSFWAARTVSAAFLIATPWVVMRYGPQIAVYYVGAIVALFAICRAVGITAFFPWVQEYVPNSVRGKYTATNNIFATLAGLVSVSIAGYVHWHIRGTNGLYFAHRRRHCLWLHRRGAGAAYPRRCAG